MVFPSKNPGTAFSQIAGLAFLGAICIAVIFHIWRSNQEDQRQILERVREGIRERQVTDIDLEAQLQGETRLELEIIKERTQEPAAVMIAMHSVVVDGISYVTQSAAAGPMHSVVIDGLTYIPQPPPVYKP